jgi:hypothetical protein
MKKILQLFLFFWVIDLEASIIRIPQDYPTIQMGIDSAMPYDTLCIAADSFHELIEIYKPLTIIGAGKDSTIITPPDTFIPEELGFNWNIRISSDSIKIMNLTQYGRIEDWGGYYPSKIGIKIDSSNQIEIKNCVICYNGILEPIKSGTKNDSIEISGIFFSNSSNIWIIGTKIIHNRKVGIEGRNSQHILLQDNNISHTTGVYWGQSRGVGCGYGIMLHKCDSIIISTNIIYTKGRDAVVDGSGGYGYGIWSDSCNSVIVIKNEISVEGGIGTWEVGMMPGAGGSAYGIWAKRGEDISIDKNVISLIEGGTGAWGGEGYGIFLYDYKYVSLENNELFSICGGENKLYGGGGCGVGISISQVSYCEIVENSIFSIGRKEVIYGGGAIGIKANSGMSNIISKNIISHILGGGLGWKNGGDAIGIIIEEEINSKVTQNTILHVKGGWSEDSMEVTGEGIGIKCVNVSCVIEKNAIMDNQLGIKVCGKDVVIRDCNFYFNTYQRYPTTLEYNYELQTDSLILAQNNFWWYTDSIKIRSLIQGPVNFVPFVTTPIESTPGEPLEVTSVKILNNYVRYGDHLNIKLQGTNWNNSYIEPAMVIIKSKKAPLGIGVALIETDTMSGTYQGEARVDTISNDVWNIIGSHPEDTIIVCANVDSTKCDTILVNLYGVEERAKPLNSKLSPLLYPNPFIHNIVVEFKNLKVPQVIRIYDLSGRLVKEIKNTNQKLKIGKKLVSGVYFVKMKGYNLVKIIKIKQ